MSEMQRLGLFAALLMVIGLVPVISSFAKSQMPVETSMGPSPAQDVKLEMHFSISEPNSEIIAYRDYESHPAFDGRISRWSKKFPWLGFAAEGSVWQEVGKDLETSIDADTDFDPMASPVLLRNPNWRIRPFVVIGPTVIISERGKHKVDSLNHIFTGIYYNF